MNILPRSIRVRGIAIGLACLTTAGCFLQTLFGVASVAGGSLIFSVNTNVALTTCTQGAFGSPNIECTYFILDPNGVPVEVTSSTMLIAEFGILGLIIDPLILQIPRDITIRSATYDAGTGAQPLAVTITESFPVDAVTIAQAEAGQKFAIFEFPDTLAPMIPGGDATTGLPVGLSIEMVRTRAPGFLNEPFPVKGVFTIPFNVANTTYYVPMLPCTSDFSQIPAFQVDPDAGNADLVASMSALLLSVTACNNRTYDFVSIGPQLLVSTDDLDFGATLIGTTANRILTLTSVGPATLSINAIGAPAVPDFAVIRDDCTGNQFNQGESCELELTYQPGAAGAAADSLTVTSNDINYATTSVAIRGAGSAAPPVAASNCTSADLGVAGSGAQQSFRRTLWNEGGANLTIDSVSLADSTHFALSADECTGAVLAPTFGCGVEVSYQPQSAGEHSTMLLVSSSDPGAALNAVIRGANVADVLFQNSFETVCGG